MASFYNTFLSVISAVISAALLTNREDVGSKPAYYQKSEQGKF
jgi:hypothetical protein